MLEAALMILSTLFFLIALFFSFQLSKETKGEQYWFFFLIAAIAFGIAHLASKLPRTETWFDLQEMAEIAGAFSLAYATYGLYSSMKKIREKLGKELDKG